MITEEQRFIKAAIRDLEQEIATLRAMVSQADRQPRYSDCRNVKRLKCKIAELQGRKERLIDKLEKQDRSIRSY